MKYLSRIFGGVLYVIAGFLFIYSIWALIHSIGYIGNLMSSGQLEFARNEYDIVSFYMTNCGQYAIYTIVMFALGWIIARKSDTRAISEEQIIVKKERDEKELDEWFNESND